MNKENRIVHGRKKGTFCLVGGMLLIAAAFFLTLFNIYDSMRAERNAGGILKGLEKEMEEGISADSFENPEPSDGRGDQAPDDYELFPDKEMPVIEVNGIWYIGILEIPVLDMKLPVTEEWSYENLRESLCCYSGSLYQDDLVIAGHNYRRFFRSLNHLAPGTEIRFTDVEGNVFFYQAVWTEVLESNEGKEMTRASDDWDLTLFTCTYGGKQRIAVRCVKKEGSD